MFSDVRLRPDTGVGKPLVTYNFSHILRRTVMSDERSELPKYDELPPAPGGGRSGWGMFGETDSVGLLNLQTNPSVLAGAGLVRKGSVFSLNAELGAVSPPLDEDRAMLRHRVLHQPEPGFPDLDDVLDNF